jgi:putative transposase
MGPASVGEGFSGNVTDEMWADYIKNQTPTEPDDNFNVT